jgi:DNA-binding CsgD family transcriptional regulator
MSSIVDLAAKRPAQAVLAMWRQGFDTEEISRLLGLTEADVYNLLARRA